VSLKYDDLDLQITPVGDHYRVHLNGPTGQAAADFILPFTDVDVSNFLGRIGQVRRTTRRAEAPELHAAKDFGGKLFSAVFSGELIAQLRSSVEQSLNNDRGLRIRLRLNDAPELADLPWEFLYDAAQNHFLTTSTETPLVRFLDLPQRIAPLRASLPLRVLVVIASPKNLKRLDAEGEWERLQETLADLIRAGNIVLERLPAATLDALRLRARGAPFHIFHFIGHGGFDNIAEDGVLQFEDEKGMSHPVRGELLGMQLHDHRSLRLAVLNACEGARSSRQDPFSGVAQSLLQQRVPAVVAMQFEISDSAAKVFAREFYCAIAEGNPVDAAVCESRKALFNEDFGQEWATPVLYMRSHEGLLFDLDRTAASAPTTKSGEHERAEAERRAAAVVEAERAAGAEKERQEREMAEQARLAKESAERERLAKEKKEAERRIAEKEQTERTAAVEKERQARESAKQERLGRERLASEKLVRSAAPSEIPTVAQASDLIPNPAATATATATQVPPARPRLPLWQILLLSIPVAGLLLALSWHHLRPHHDEPGSAEQVRSSQPPQNPELQRTEPLIAQVETPAAGKRPDVTAPAHPVVAAAAKQGRSKDGSTSEPSTASRKDESSAESKPAPQPPPVKAPLPAAAPADAPPLRVTEPAQRAKLVDHVTPAYPVEATQEHITGMVQLDVIIAKDGTVRSVNIVTGNPVLGQAATAAVKQWRYQPTLVNNHAVEVETMVTVAYTPKAPEPSAQLPPMQAPPCTLGRVDFQEGGSRLVGTVPFTYTGNAQLQTMAIRGVPLTADKKQIPGLSLGQSTLQVASGSASFSIDGHPSLAHTGEAGENVLVELVVKSTNQAVCSKVVPYHKMW
jgi:TonB family protein